MANVLFVVGLVVFLCSSELLGMQAAGFVDYMGVRGTPLSVLCLGSLLGGALGMSLMSLSGPYRGMPALVSGAVMSVGIFFATYLYLGWRESFRRVEVLIPFVVGVIPGYLLLRLLSRSHPD